MYCQNCGTFIADDSVFCYSCGAKIARIEDVQLPVAQQTENDQTTVDQQIETDFSTEYGQATSSQQNAYVQEQVVQPVETDQKSVTQYVEAVQPPAEQTTAIQQPTETDQSLKKCPYCAEMIQAEAIVCRYCHSRLDGGTSYTANTIPAQQPDTAPVYQQSAAASPSPVTQKREIKLKYIFIAMNILAFIEIFIPVFMLPAIKSYSTGLSYLGLDSGINADLSPISYFSFFKWIELFSGNLKNFGVLTPVVIAFCLFLTFEIVSVIMLIKSFDKGNSDYNVLEYSKISIIFLMGINVVSIIAVLTYNALIQSGILFIDYLLKSFNLSFPVSSVVFLVIDIVFLIVLNKLKDHFGIYAAANKNSSYSGKAWTCDNCNTINSAKSEYCEQCNKKRKSVIQNPLPTDWRCKTCGTYNSSKSACCMNCGNKR